MTMRPGPMCYFPMSYARAGCNQLVTPMNRRKRRCLRLLYMSILDKQCCAIHNQGGGPKGVLTPPRLASHVATWPIHIIIDIGEKRLKMMAA